MLQYNLSVVYAYRGEYDKASELLRQVLIISSLYNFFFPFLLVFTFSHLTRLCYLSAVVERQRARHRCSRSSHYIGFIHRTSDGYYFKLFNLVIEGGLSM